MSLLRGSFSLICGLLGLIILLIGIKTSIIILIMLAALPFVAFAGITLSNMVQGSRAEFFKGFLLLTIAAIAIDSVAKNMLLDYQPLFFYVFNYWPLSILHMLLWGHTGIGIDYPYIGDAIGILVYAGILKAVVRRVAGAKKGSTAD